MRKSAVLFFIFFISFAGSSFAQKTTIYVDQDSEFKSALELFQKQKYAAAQNAFNKVAVNHDKYSIVTADAEYYSAICAVELFHKDAELLLKNFIASHPESPKARTAYFYLGKYNYRKKNYDDAVKWFEKVEVFYLDTREAAEFYFKRGYSYFMQGDIEKAKKDFFEIKDKDSKYSGPASYYFSHIAYNEKNYETALQGFLKLKDNETFASVVPYYIAQIYYLQHKYDEVISYAPALLDSSTTKRAPEIARIIGESYYHTKRYKEAIPFLKKFEAGTNTSEPKDMYVLGFAYYKTGDCSNAINYFKNATRNEDSLAQNAYYHLGDCYIRSGNKVLAKPAFASASRLNFDKQIKEDALFAYAKLCYELSNNPFDDAIEAFNEYIKLYPSSLRKDEAYGYLVNVYLTTKNYKEALQSIERVKSIGEELKPAYQKIAYFRGVDLFNNLEYAEAIKHFDKALIYRSDKAISAQSIYWKAESFYRLKRYGEAIDNYSIFLSEPGSFNLPEFTNAQYNIGYSFFQLKEYANSLIPFRKYVLNKNEKSRKINDAYNRIGDAYFMTRDYSGAAQNYSEALKIRKTDVDYSLYQHALASGLQKNYQAKTADLEELMNSFPRSPYTVSARYEAGRAFVIMNQPDKALDYFKKIINENQSSTYYNKALLQAGLIYYNRNDDKEAFNYFDMVVKKDRKSNEGNEALGFIKKIYAEKGDTEGMETYFNSVSANLPSGYLDTTAFEIGRKQYLSNECENAIPSFAKYIEKYPNGIFIDEANFYKAECDYRKGNNDAALTGYNFVIGKNKPEFMETALANAAEISYRNKKYQDALSRFLQLEIISENPKNIIASRLGVMRSSYYLNNYQQAIDYASKVLSMEKLQPELAQEAQLIKGRSYLATNQNDLALAEFRALANSTRNEKGAEAKYNVAFLQYSKAEYKDVQKTLFELINQSSYAYWINKALLLLADNYVALNDLFQAKHTLNSIIESSDIPEFVKEATQKLEAIKAKENSGIQKMPSDTIQLEIKDK